MILLAVLLLAQEPQTLAWKLEKGARFEASWDAEIALKIRQGGRVAAEIQATVRLKAEVEVVEAAADGAAQLQIRPRRVEMKGSAQDRPFDILLEGEKIVRPEDFPPERAKAMMAPIAVKVQAGGRFEPEGEHPLKATLGGRGCLFGPELPARAVKPGDTWQGVLQTGKAAVKGVGEYRVTYTLAGIEDGRARVTCAEEQDVPEAPFPVKARFKTDGLFDPAAGRWVRFTSSTRAFGARPDDSEGFDAFASFTFEAK